MAFSVFLYFVGDFLLNSKCCHLSNTGLRYSVNGTLKIITLA